MSKACMSQRTQDFLDACAYESLQQGLVAINAPMLLKAFVDDGETGLSEYLEPKATDDKIQDAIEILQEERSKIENGKKDLPNEDEKKVPELNPNSCLYLQDQKEKRHGYSVTEELRKVFDKLVEICSEQKITVFNPEHILLAMFEVQDPTLKDFFDTWLGLNFNEAKNHFKTTLLKEKPIIPKNLSGFMECLNDKVDPTKPCEILGRDDEVEKIWTISLKRYKRNTIIVGEAGVGKSALIDKIVYDIVTDKCPDEFRGFSVVSLDVNALIAGTMYRGQTEARIKEMISFLKNSNNIILFIDEAHTVLGAGSCHEGEMDLSNALKPILARGETIVICATTTNEYLMYFAQDTALSRRFEMVEVTEPNSDEVWPMIRNKVKALEEFHGVKISEAMVQHAIMIADCFAFEKQNPDKTLDLIDRSMVAAKRRGKTKVDKKSIIANFNIYFDLYNGMSEASKEEIAYHESGHYIAYKALADSLVEVRLLAVSIMPAEGYLGVTCYEFRKDKVPFANKEYYLNRLAAELAGRAAERKFTNDLTAGAQADLAGASNQAEQVVTQFGFSNTNGQINKVYPSFWSMSDKTKGDIETEVQMLIDEAYKIAERIIDENYGFLTIMVEKLLANGIMSEKELDKLWVEYQEKKQK